jgi:chromosome partitioning protein
MQTIVVATLKGGAGKTTTSLALAGALAATGRRVALFDGDPQATTTKTFRLAPEREPWDAEPVALQLPGLQPDAITVVRGGRPLAIATDDQLSAFFEKELDSSIDYAIIDTPPGSIGILLAACAVADLVLVTVDTSPYGLDGMVDVLQLLPQLDPPPPVRVVLTRTHARRKVTEEVQEHVRVRYPNMLCETMIPEDVRCVEAPAAALPVTLYSPTCRASEAYAALAEELVKALAEETAASGGAR